MYKYAIIISGTIIGLFDELRDAISNKPMLSILFPVSGFGASYIPTPIASINQGGVALDIIAIATPYLRFIFLILTLALTIISLILQWRKIRNKNNK